MKLSILITLVLSPLSITNIALAEQTATDASSGLDATPPPQPGRPAAGANPARLRAGIAGIFGVANTSRQFAVDPLGLRLQIGGQLRDELAFSALLVGGTSLFLTAEARAALLVEWTPVPLLSVGSGFSYEHFRKFGCFLGDCIEARFSGWSVPLTVAFHRSDRARAGSRHAFTFGLEGRAGLVSQDQNTPIYSPWSPTFASPSELMEGASFFFGYDLM